MNLLQKLTSLTGLALIGLFFSPQALAQDGEPFRTRTFDVSSSAEFSAETSGSSVKVTGTGGDQIVVRMYAKDKNGDDYLSADEVNENLGDYTLRMEHSGNEVELVFKRKNSVGWNWGDQKMRVYFEVEVPEQTETTFRTSGGSISLDGVSGDHDIGTSGGSVSISRGEGDIYARSSGGSFALSDFSGDIEVKTSGGSVSMDGLDGDIEVYTSGGSVKMSDVSGSIGAYTSGGSIRAELVDITDDLEFKSSGGGITVAVPSTAGLDLDLRGGRVAFDMVNFNGKVEKDRVEGEMNGGGHSLTMQSSGGRLKLEYTE